MLITHTWVTMIASYFVNIFHYIKGRKLYQCTFRVFLTKYRKMSWQRRTKIKATPKTMKAAILSSGVCSAPDPSMSRTPIKIAVAAKKMNQKKLDIHQNFIISYLLEILFKIFLEVYTVVVGLCFNLLEFSWRGGYKKSTVLIELFQNGGFFL